MKKIAGLMIFVVILTLNSFPLQAKVIEKSKKIRFQNQVCTVADPTGTPLNVRNSPVNGKIVAKLKNGTVVRVEQTNDDAGDETALWWRISITANGKRRTLGWVTSKFLNCN